jgi:hypothetical protein
MLSDDGTPASAASTFKKFSMNLLGSADFSFCSLNLKMVEETGNGPTDCQWQKVARFVKFPILDYCLSKTLEVLKSFPSAVFPFALTVATFPSLDTSASDFAISFPPFVNVAVVLLALIRFMVILSAPPGMPDPVTADALPSKLLEKLYDIALPSAATPSYEYFKPLPSAVIVRVKLLGNGTPSDLDFSAFSFHVPINGLSCANKGRVATAPQTRIANTIITLFMQIPRTASAPRSVMP